MTFRGGTFSSGMTIHYGHTKPMLEAVLSKRPKQLELSGYPDLAVFTKKGSSLADNLDQRI